MKKILIIFTLFLSNYIYAECYELNYTDCLYWSEYCEWNDEADECQEIGGDGSGNTDGPYQYATITESQGLRNGPDYRDGVLYYPIDAETPYKSIVLTPGWGSNGASMSNWAQYFASHGFIAMTIGPNDEINDSHQQRAEGLLDGIETIVEENSRESSPINGMIDINNFSVCGYSMGGGASQIAATYDNSIVSVISLNPTVIFEDCEVCPEEDGYCICLVPEFLDHPVPTLIYEGETEINEMPEYDGLLGEDCYENTPETTEKILFEVAGDGHGATYAPYGEIADYVLYWLNYQVLDDNSYCELLLNIPSTSSQYLTNLDCIDSIIGDINGDLIVNVQDIILTVNLILNNEYNILGDINLDNAVDVLDIVQLINIILN